MVTLTLIFIFILLSLLIIFFKAKSKYFKYSFLLLLIAAFLFIGTFFWISLPATPSDLIYSEHENGVVIQWKGLKKQFSNYYQIIILQNGESDPFLNNPDIIHFHETVLKTEGQDYIEEYIINYWLESDYYDESKYFSYYCIPSDYEKPISTDSELYYLYVHQEWMEPVKPYWIMKIK